MSTRPGTRKYVANPADLPRGTLVQLFFDAIDRHDKQDAFRHKVRGGWRSISHAAFQADVRRLGLALEWLGVRRGDRVAILSENRPEWALADYATLCVGGVVTPIYATLPSNQIAPILRDAGARLIFVSTAEQLEKVRRARAELPALERIVVFEEVEVGGEGELTLGQALELGRREEAEGRGEGFRERALAADPEDLATIIYTSGTTGEPKGVMLTHANVYSNVRAVERVIEVSPSDVVLSFLPLSHVFERMADYYLFWKGCTIAYAESIEAIAQNMVEVRPTLMVGTPRLYEKVYARVMEAGGLKRRVVEWAKGVAVRWAEARSEGRSPGLALRLERLLADGLVYRKLRERTGGRIRFFVSGGAPLSPEVGKFFYGAGLPVYEGYGLTETSPVTNVNTPAEFRFGTVGKPVPGTEIMIAEDGEILVRGPQVMKGYFNQPEATREVIDEDGWFHTGDVGEIDEDGFLRITDRKKDLIVTAGGKNIAPQPIENRVKLNRFVAEAVVIGDRRPYPVMLVVPNFEALGEWAAQNGVAAEDRGALLRDERVRRKMEAEVFGMLDGFARFEVPKKVAFLEQGFTIEAGQMTPTLKVRRRVVEAECREVIEALYAESERLLVVE
ncbi:MAG TPA: long-chain fatty acid--CoA ligase [Longimicrobiales bacterium]